MKYLGRGIWLSDYDTFVFFLTLMVLAGNRQVKRY